VAKSCVCISKFTPDLFVQISAVVMGLLACVLGVLTITGASINVNSENNGTAKANGVAGIMVLIVGVLILIWRCCQVRWLLVTAVGIYVRHFFNGARRYCALFQVVYFVLIVGILIVYNLAYVPMMKARRKMERKLHTCLATPPTRPTLSTTFLNISADAHL
jgi:hypothetical protein